MTVFKLIRDVITTKEADEFVGLSDLQKKNACMISVYIGVKIA